jgi:hypothetical protein
MLSSLFRQYDIIVEKCINFINPHQRIVRSLLVCIKYITRHWYVGLNEFLVFGECQALYT